MVTVSAWLLAAILIIAVIIVAVGVGWLLRNNKNKNQQQSPASQGLTHPLVWTPGIAGPNDLKNTCQIYQFPTTIAPGTTGASGIAFLGNPTFNINTLNKLIGVTLTNKTTCIDVDQIIAQQIQHSCTGPLGVLDNSYVRCVTLNGKEVGWGDVETYYSNVLCPSIPQCPGELSLISLNYHGVSSDLYCISMTGNSGTTQLGVMVECNPSDQSQLFRITRINPGQNPDTLQPGSQNGTIAQIYDRNSGLCLAPDTSSNKWDYYPNYVDGINPNCTGGLYSGYTGLNITLSSCTGGPYPGYVWVLFPSISYCGITAGCSGCTNGYSRLENSNQCCDVDNNCPGTAGYESFSTPQEIFYIGGLDYSNIPLKGSTSNLFQWFIENNVPRLFFGGDVSSGGTGSPSLIYPSKSILPGVDNSTCTGLSSTDQYINLQLYNTLIQQQTCSAATGTTESYCFF